MPPKGGLGQAHQGKTPQRSGRGKVEKTPEKISVRGRKKKKRIPSDCTALPTESALLSQTTEEDIPTLKGWRRNGDRLSKNWMKER